MGMFLQTMIIPDIPEDQVKSAVEKVAKEQAEGESMGLVPRECRYQVHDRGVSVLLNDDCVGFEDLASVLSKETGRPVMMLYIYDGDFWGYFLLENGEIKDTFNPMPDYFEEIPEEEKESMKGNAALLAEYFHVDAASVEKYLVFWTEDMLEKEGQKAYEEDEFEVGEDWQMADFMRSLGYPYEWE